ncbi:MAG TPA: hypothetical protein VH187_00380 [Scandinavium sp.]|jgi:hypothetical protein|uniref:hypothetical protein n=1 Tax=Scandinavium sp. TaxID=2830653 RepID=UPI002E355FBF|nr:hypothetical protein [Scandinavium sp.]HEX4499616.1 hypothetical protein [Scandinavium sp.]
MGSFGSPFSLENKALTITDIVARPTASQDIPQLPVPSRSAIPSTIFQLTIFQFQAATTTGKAPASKSGNGRCSGTVLLLYLMPDVPGMSLEKMSAIKDGNLTQARLAGQVIKTES